MASLVKLYDQLVYIKKEYIKRKNIAVEHSQREYVAAIKIQSWFRGCQVRAYVRYLHQSATLIQKTWRGFRTRQHVRQKIKTVYYLMKMIFYNKMAVKIQRQWRGYYVRKYIHSYYERKRYLEAVTKKNEQIRKEIEEISERQKKERERIAIEKDEQEKYLHAQRFHFLLSTKIRPGVFNCPFRPEPDEMEMRLRAVKPLQMRPAPKKTATNQQPSGFLCSLERPPPTHKTPQGPFKPAAEVWQQRHRPLEASIHMVTSTTVLEEVRQQLRQCDSRTPFINLPFLPFTNAHRNKKYEAFNHSHSPYQKDAYRTKHFRK